MKDYVGNTLCIGDKVVCVDIGRYGLMKKTEVVGFTDKEAILENQRIVSPYLLVVYSHAPVVLEDIL